MTTRFISRTELASLVSDLLGAGTKVVAPVKAGPGPQEVADYRFIHRAEELYLGQALPRRSIKEFFFPPTEVLLRWKQKRQDVVLEEVPVTFEPRVILGAKPCDAAAVEVLDRVMGWDYKDELWFGRRQATTVISLACPGVDGSCFCTALDLAPDTRKGADVLMIPAGQGFMLEAVTDKGQAFMAKHAARLSDTGDKAAAEAFCQTARDKVAANFTEPVTDISKWVGSHFENELWKGIALRCHGCGACASVCPTCHCFDIVDEPEGLNAGTRRRNWDTCQTGKFTVHASGHNPRENQDVRYRQRINHKFSIYPQKFEEVLCTGCGRCSRACPAGMDLGDVLQEIARAARAEAPAEGVTP